MTVANVGDSRAVVDTGAETVLLTEDHRVATHQGERRRLDAMGATIAPIDISGAAREASVSPLWVGPGLALRPFH